VDFYSSLYKKPKSDPVSYSGFIESFLGEEICNHDIVKNSKIPVHLKNTLDMPLTIAELDTALKEANKKSAPGPDGLSMNFICRFWGFFRDPLLKYALACFGKGTLTNTFKMAHVRLIPKKDDATKIKNWRPISLLSNMYKLIS